MLPSYFFQKQIFSAYTTRYTIYEELTEALKADSTFKDVKVDVNAIEVIPAGVELSWNVLKTASKKITFFNFEKIKVFKQYLYA